MRNKCKHINIETLMPHINSLGNAQIEWCRNCGSRRFVAVYPNGGFSGKTGRFEKPLRSCGKWKSPTTVRK